jgi:hypothetical protein
LKDRKDLSKKHTSEHMKEYCTNQSLVNCRRKILYRDFPDYQRDVYVVTFARSHVCWTV